MASLDSKTNKYKWLQVEMMIKMEDTQQQAQNGWLILDEQALRTIVGGVGENPSPPPDAP